MGHVMARPWENSSAPLHSRVSDLLSLLTLGELIGQLGGPDIPGINRSGLVLPPYTFGIECLAGVAQAKVSSAFPLPVNLGASFDPCLVADVASAIGDEARALYNMGEIGSMHCLGPVLNLARDPRWGRSYESYGEDPHLISRLGEAYVRGMTMGPGAANVSSPRFAKIGAVAKHAAAYNFEGRLLTILPRLLTTQSMLLSQCDTTILLTTQLMRFTTQWMRSTLC